MHRSLDGTCKENPPWIRIKIRDIDMHNPEQVEGRKGKKHYRFRVTLELDCRDDENLEIAKTSFEWKDGVSFEENHVVVPVFVKNYEMFQHGVEWKYTNTSKIWAGDFEGVVFLFRVRVRLLGRPLCSSCRLALCSISPSSEWCGRIPCRDYCSDVASTNPLSEQCGRHLCRS